MTTEHVVWLAVNEDGVEGKYRSDDLVRLGGAWIPANGGAEWRPLPPGTIEKLIGRKLTWEDEPV